MRRSRGRDAARRVVLSVATAALLATGSLAAVSPSAAAATLPAPSASSDLRSGDSPAAAGQVPAAPGTTSAHVVPVTGRLTDVRTGRPLTGWDVWDGDSAQRNSPTRTDGQGRFALTTAYRGSTPRHRFGFRDRFGAVVERVVLLRRSGSTQRLGTLRLSVPPHVSGDVRTSDGKVPVDGAVVTVFELDGSVARSQLPRARPLKATATTDAMGRFSIGNVLPGRYRLGVHINHLGLPGEILNRGRASMFWSSQGGTGVFASGTAITLRPSTSTSAGRSFSRSIRLPHGAEVTGAVVGAWEHGPYVQFTPVPAAPKSARRVVTPVVTSDFERNIGPAVRSRFISSAIAPGRYRVSIESMVFDAAGKATGYKTFYYTGSGKAPTTSAKGAAIITISSGTRTVELGVLDTTL